MAAHLSHYVMSRAFQPELCPQVAGSDARAAPSFAARALGGPEDRACPLRDLFASQFVLLSRGPLRRTICDGDCALLFLSIRDVLLNRS